MDAALKQELQEVAEILKLFPQSLQERVFEIAISGSLDAKPAAGAPAAPEEPPATAQPPKRKRRRKSSGKDEQGSTAKRKTGANGNYSLVPWS